MFCPHTRSLSSTKKTCLSKRWVLWTFVQNLAEVCFVLLLLLWLSWIDQHPLHWGQTPNKRMKVIKNQHLVRYLHVSILFTKVPQPKREVTRDSAFSMRRCSRFSADWCATERKHHPFSVKGFAHNFRSSLPTCLYLVLLKYVSVSLKLLGN